jgi:hypothetical protein
MSTEDREKNIMSKSQKPKPSSPRPVASPRWNLEHSPLKISYWYGSPDAPAEVKTLVAEHEASCGENLKRQEKCILLTWKDALAVLHRADIRLFHFHPQDYDWQVNGWKFQEGARLDPLTEDEIRTYPHLPAIPSNADIFAEVMVQYSRDIDQMELRNPRLFKTLIFEREACVEPALRGLFPATDATDATDVAHRLDELDVRALYRRVYEILATGHSDINPISETIALNEEQAARLKEALGAETSVQ